MRAIFLDRLEEVLDRLMRILSAFWEDEGGGGEGAGALRRRWRELGSRKAEVQMGCLQRGGRVDAWDVQGCVLAGRALEGRRRARDLGGKEPAPRRDVAVAVELLAEMGAAFPTSSHRHAECPTVLLHPPSFASKRRRKEDAARSKQGKAG